MALEVFVQMYPATGTVGDTTYQTDLAPNARVEETIINTPMVLPIAQFEETATDSSTYVYNMKAATAKITVTGDLTGTAGQIATKRTNLLSLMGFLSNSNPYTDFYAVNMYGTAAGVTRCKGVITRLTFTSMGGEPNRMEYIFELMRGDNKLENLW